MAKGLLALCTVVLLSLWLGSCSEGTDPDGGEVRVLILSNYQPGNDWIDSSYVKHMDNMVFSSMDIGDSIPTLDDFVGYDVILLYEDGLFDNCNEVGDLLYYYVLAGGNLVMGTFYWQDRTLGGYSSSETWGLLELIDPIYGNSCDYEYDSLGQVSNHDLTKGVNSLKTYYRGGVDTLRNDAAAVAWWTDGSVLIAYNRPNNKGTITAVTTAPQEGYYWDWRGYPNAPEGDFFRLWENVLRWTASRGSGFSLDDVVLGKAASSQQKSKQKTETAIQPSGSQLIK